MWPLPSWAGTRTTERSNPRGVLRRNSGPIRAWLSAVTFTYWGWAFKLQVSSKFAGQDFIPHQGKAREAPVAYDVTWPKRSDMRIPQRGQGWSATLSTSNPLPGKTISGESCSVQAQITSSAPIKWQTTAAPLSQPSLAEPKTVSTSQELFTVFCMDLFPKNILT